MSLPRFSIRFGLPPLARRIHRQPRHKRERLRVRERCIGAFDRQAASRRMMTPTVMIHTSVGGCSFDSLIGVPDGALRVHRGEDTASHQERADSEDQDDSMFHSHGSGQGPLVSSAFLARPRAEESEKSAGVETCSATTQQCSVVPAHANRRKLAVLRAGLGISPCHDSAPAKSTSAHVTFTAPFFRSPVQAVIRSS